jgi:hypothetical protein
MRLTGARFLPAAPEQGDPFIDPHQRGESRSGAGGEPVVEIYQPGDRPRATNRGAQVHIVRPTCRCVWRTAIIGDRRAIGREAPS